MRQYYKNEQLAFSGSESKSLDFLPEKATWFCPKVNNAGEDAQYLYWEARCEINLKQAIHTLCLAVTYEN